MEILKNKLFILLLVVVLIAAVMLWLRHPKSDISKPQLIEWMAKGYTQQFCNVIYPRIANCVTLRSNECVPVARAQINDCIDAIKSNIPESNDQLEAKKIYNSISQCFVYNMHTLLLRDYQVHTPECQNQLS